MQSYGCFNVEVQIFTSNLTDYVLEVSNKSLLNIGQV